MNKYVVRDKSGNLMNWGEFSCEEFADEAIGMYVLGEMSSDGHDTVWVEDGGEFDEYVFYQYCDKYIIEEII